MFLSRRLGAGGGTTLPGRIARRIDPQLLAGLVAHLAQGSVIVTGTNGKTTTSRMISGILSRAGLQPVHNRSGANLITGITTALLTSTDLRGRPGGDIGLFEIDEATLPQAVAEVSPRAIVLTNLFRDQLDRYGEINHIAGLWRGVLRALPPGAVVVLNADDPLVASLGRDTSAQTVYFGIEDARAGSPNPQHAADSKRCVDCGTPYHYQVTYYSHLGHYACPNCGTDRPQPNVYARRLELVGTQGAGLELALPQGPLSLHLGLPGLYNVYNALAALACCASLGVPAQALRQGVESFAAAFGRIERIGVDGRQVFLALVKNPVGLTEVLRMLVLDKAPKHLLIAINDNLADGTDVSWLWDADLELLQGKVATVTVSGTRAEDMQLRLRYAGLDMAQVSLEKDLRAAFMRALRRVPTGGTLYILPTYTALLQVRQVIDGVGHIGHFWQD